MFEFPESYHVSSNFAERRYYTNLKSPYFRSAGGYGHMAGHAGSPMCIAHTDVTLTWSKVKVTELLKIALFYVYLRHYFGIALTTDRWLP